MKIRVAKGLLEQQPALLGQIARRLRPKFAPASSLQPPTSTLANRGNRQTAISSATNNPPTDQTTVFLKGGATQWNFKTQFKSAPIVTLTMIGAPSVATTQVFLSAPPTPNGVLIMSTDSNDARQLHIHAQGNPN